MTTLIAGDIGGTKTILRHVRADRGSAHVETLAQETYPSKAFSDLVPMVRQFWEQHPGEQPEIACFAIAGPVVENTCKLTNLDWYLESDRLQRELNLAKVTLINDFAAVSYGVRQLEAGDIETLQAGIFDPSAPVAIIGAGTGLGESFLIPQGNDVRVFPTEGGHADFAPRTQDESWLLFDLRDRYALDRVSVERVVSGQGIVAIYQFWRDREYAPETPAVAEVVRAWEANDGAGVDAAAAISQAGQEKRDRLSELAMSTFIDAYAAEAGNLALKLLPYGGLYVAGGIAAKILPLLQTGRFLEVFKQKGRMKPLLDRVPVYVVLNPQVGLIGSVQYALNS